MIIFGGQYLKMKKGMVKFERDLSTEWRCKVFFPGGRVDSCREKGVLAF